MTFKELKEIKSLTQSKLAEICGVSERTIRYWLAGKGEPRKSQWEKVENYKG